MNELEQRVRDYLTASGVAVTVFCRAVNLSRTHLYGWLDGDRQLSNKAAQRISNYLTQFNF